MQTDRTSGSTRNGPTENHTLTARSMDDAAKRREALKIHAPRPETAEEPPRTGRHLNVKA